MMALRVLAVLRFHMACKSSSRFSHSNPERLDVLDVRPPEYCSARPAFSSMGMQSWESRVWRRRFWSEVRPPESGERERRALFIMTVHLRCCRTWACRIYPGTGL